MSTKVVPGQLIAVQDTAQAAAEAAPRIGRALRNAVRKQGSATLALSGGNTPLETYALLARTPDVEWSKVHVFWVDERAVPPTDARSNYRGAKSALLDPAGLDPSRIHRMEGEAPDLEAAARAYEKLVRQYAHVDEEGVPAFDVVVLGIGEDGHTASLFPGEPTVDVVDRLVTSVPAALPKHEARLTITAPAIEHARNVFILTLGAGKRPALDRVWAAQGALGETPARVVRGCHGTVAWVIDRAAGGLTD